MQGLGDAVRIEKEEEKVFQFPQLVFARVVVRSAHTAQGRGRDRDFPPLPTSALQGPVFPAPGAVGVQSLPAQLRQVEQEVGADPTAKAFFSWAGASLGGQCWDPDPGQGLGELGGGSAGGGHVPAHWSWGSRCNRALKQKPWKESAGQRVRETEGRSIRTQIELLSTRLHTGAGSTGSAEQ